MNNSIRILTFILSLLPTCILLSTPQIPDKIFINNNEYPLYTELFYDEIDEETQSSFLNNILIEAEKNNLFVCLSTALRRGWRCSWKIENNMLYLLDVEVRAFVLGDENEEVKLHSLKLNNINIPNFELSKKNYFFTGTLWIPLGDPIGINRVSTFGYEYKEMMKLELKDGKIVNASNFYNINSCNNLTVSLNSIGSNECVIRNIGFFNSPKFKFTIESPRTSCDKIIVHPSSQIFSSDGTINLLIIIMPNTLHGHFKHSIFFEVNERIDDKKLITINITGEAT